MGLKTPLAADYRDRARAPTVDGSGRMYLADPLLPLTNAGKSRTWSRFYLLNVVTKSVSATVWPARAASMEARSAVGIAMSVSAA